jgi:hypothetical protein
MAADGEAEVDLARRERKDRGEGIIGSQSIPPLILANGSKQVSANYLATPSILFYKT